MQNYSAFQNAELFCISKCRIILHFKMQNYSANCDGSKMQNNSVNENSQSIYCKDEKVKKSRLLFKVRSKSKNCQVTFASF